EWALRHALGPDQVRVTFLDVGQGDAALIETGTGQAALIDGGGNVGGGPDPGQAAVLPLLRSRRIAALDLMVLTHPHPDHYGGLFAVLQAMPVRELWDTGQAQAEAESDDGPVARLLADARAHGTRVRRPEELCYARRTLGATSLSVLSPCPSFELALGPNDNSYVLRLEHGVRSFLFTGDIERETELALSKSPERLRSDVLKVGHHGSRTSSTQALLEAVSPWLAVVSAGRANHFGHPHPEVVERLARSAHVLQTNRVGGVQVLSDGVSLTVTSTLEPSVLKR
ncbi:MAG: Competence protein ComEC/Rec2-related protein, partial [Myxococcaceae bacterium]|nr:Competence protein ComEC/Rec2-related protein [Myxococcaceae bacterium]